MINKEKQQKQQECNKDSCSQEMIVSHLINELKKNNLELFNKLLYTESTNFTPEEKGEILHAISPNYNYDPATQKNDTDMIRVFQQSVINVKNMNDTSTWWNNENTFKEKPYKDFITRLDE